MDGLVVGKLWKTKKSKFEITPQKFKYSDKKYPQVTLLFYRLI